MTPLFLEEKYNREHGIKVAPDTIGVDYLFILGFVTEDMEADFPFIERQFLENCRHKLEEFYKVGTYGEDTGLWQ